MTRKIQKRTRPLIHLSLSTDATERLREISERSGRSRSSWVEQWIRDAKMPSLKKGTSLDNGG